MKKKKTNIPPLVEQVATILSNHIKTEDGEGRQQRLSALYAALKWLVPEKKHLEALIVGAYAISLSGSLSKKSREYPYKHLGIPFSLEEGLNVGMAYKGAPRDDGDPESDLIKQFMLDVGNNKIVIDKMVKRLFYLIITDTSTTINQFVIMALANNAALYYSEHPTKWENIDLESYMDNLLLRIASVQDNTESLTYIITTLLSDARVFHHLQVAVFDILLYWAPKLNLNPVLLIAHYNKLNHR